MLLAVIAAAMLLCTINIDQSTLAATTDCSGQACQACPACTAQPASNCTALAEPIKFGHCRIKKMAKGNKKVNAVVCRKNKLVSPRCLTVNLDTGVAILSEHGCVPP